MVGLFRLVCSNGLVIASEQFTDLKIRHINYSFEELRELTNRVILELPAQVDLMTQMKNFELNREQMLDMALKMYLGTDDEAVCQTVAEKAMIIGYTRMLRRAIRRPNEADSPAKIARCKEMLAILLDKTDSICF
jgi:hypothetical protein